MTLSLQKEDYLIQIRDKLRKDSIKLWLQPYYNEESGQYSPTDIENLVKDYSKALNIPADACKETILELQQNSLENLKVKSRFQECGLATLKIKIVGSKNENLTRTFNKEIMLSMRGIDFKEVISKEIDITTNRLKLISSGKVLSDSESLSSQGVKNNQQILAIIISELPGEVTESENKIKELENVKTDSRLLALDNQYMQLEDQFGNAIKIPPNEKKALIVAMTLHEKGRSALRKNDYSRALVFFLEADEEFRQCNSQLLNSVDNYALLDLDIAWCYLCLQSFAHLPEAQERLKRCDERFQKTYGANLERLIAVKGTPGNEAALFMRLHLLQAIVLYHQNHRAEAYNLLKKAEEELKGLKVDENSITALIELGYTPAEARLGLRATRGDVNFAANYINENRNKRKESRNKALAEEILQKKRKKLGKCIDGQQYVDPNFVKILVNMGYNKEVARVALQQTNNVISDSIQYIQENPIPGPSQSKSCEMLDLINDFIPELEAAGFDPRMAKLALHKHEGDIIRAAEELLANNGIVQGDLTLLNLNAESLEKIKEAVGKRKEKDEEKEEAFKRLSEDITMVDDDHLDLTLDQEEVFLRQYMSLLEKDS